MLKNKLLLVVAGIMLLSACGGANNSSGDMSIEEQEEDSTAVQVQKIQPETIERKVIYTGKVQPVQTINVNPKTSGEVQSVNFEVGDYVKAGDVLFTIDKESIQNEINKLQISLKNSELSIESAQLAVQQLNGGQEQTNLLQMQNAIDSAKIQLDNSMNVYKDAQSSYEKNKVLLASGVISQSEFNSIETNYKQSKNAYEQASATHDQAVANFKIYKEKTVKEREESVLNSLESAKVGRESAELQLKILKESLADTVVKAPISGIIASKDVNVSNVVANQSSVATILDFSSVTVDVNVSEVTVSRLSQGDEVSVIISTISSEPIFGKIKSISPIVDNSGTYPVKIQIDNKSDKIKAGMFAQVVFAEEKVDNAFVVPNAAILYDEIGKYVFIVEGNIAVKKYVEVGVDNGVNVEILSGVNKDDYVITVGTNYVKDKKSIRIVNSLGQEVTAEESSKKYKDNNLPENEDNSQSSGY